MQGQIVAADIAGIAGQDAVIVKHKERG